MQQIKAADYQKEIKEAIVHFWATRDKQNNLRKKRDQGLRSAVTGGKQLDAFITLAAKIAANIGIPNKHIFTKRNVLPGYFRPTKDWDLVITEKNKELIAVLEFKSQVGSFGNNFNNRTEEALGNAVDLWTAYREKSFPQIFSPWVGYCILVEKNDKSTKPVRTLEPHYNVRKEFRDTSYLDRYRIFCQKLMLEKHYSAASVIWTDTEGKFGYADAMLSFEDFLDSYIGFLYGKINKF